MKKVLFIVGSMRKNSFNRQCAHEVEKIIAPNAEVSYLEYADIPYMNQDIEFPAPKEIARVRKEVKEADGIWIFSPEYNSKIPGVLKNLLDWLSRPLVANDWSSGSAATGKVVTYSSIAGKSAGSGVRERLSELLTMMGMEIIGGQGTGISWTPEEYKTDTLNLTEDQIKELTEQADKFIKAL